MKFIGELTKYKKAEYLQLLKLIHFEKFQYKQNVIVRRTTYMLFYVRTVMCVCNYRGIFHIQLQGFTRINGIQVVLLFRCYKYISLKNK